MLVVDINLLQRTFMVIKPLKVILKNGECAICNRKKSMTVSHNTIQAERISDFLRNLGKKGLSVSKKMAKFVLRNPAGALEIGANVGAANESCSKAALSSLREVINFYYTGECLHLGKFVS